jgi:hypothetical protein
MVVAGKGWGLERGATVRLALRWRVFLPRRRKGLSDVRTQSLVSSPTRATRLDTQLRAG